MNALLITAIIVFGIVAIVVASLVFASKFKCKHEWEEGQVVGRDLEDTFGHTKRLLYMMCRCKKCGCYRSFDTRPKEQQD
jgi:hypothetical protein